MTEAYLTLAQAAKLAPTRPSSNAVWRWCRRGLKARTGKRIRLAHVRVGGRVFTTAESVENFFAELAEADSEHFNSRGEIGQNSKRRTEPERKRAINRAEEDLSKAGI